VSATILIGHDDCLEEQSLSVVQNGSRTTGRSRTVRGEKTSGNLSRIQDTSRTVINDSATQNLTSLSGGRTITGRIVHGETVGLTTIQKRGILRTTEGLRWLVTLVINERHRLRTRGTRGSHRATEGNSDQTKSNEEFLSERHCV